MHFFIKWPLKGRRKWEEEGEVREKNCYFKHGENRLKKKYKTQVKALLAEGFSAFACAEV